MNTDLGNVHTSGELKPPPSPELAMAGSASVHLSVEEMLGIISHKFNLIPAKTDHDTGAIPKVSGMHAPDASTPSFVYPSPFTQQPFFAQASNIFW